MCVCVYVCVCVSAADVNECMLHGGSESDSLAMAAALGTGWTTYCNDLIWCHPPPLH